MHLSGSGAPRFPPRCRPMKPLTEDELRDEWNKTNTTMHWLHLTSQQKLEFAQMVGAGSIKTISTNRKIKACLAIAEDGTYCVYGSAGKMNEEDKSLNKSIVSQGLDDLTYYDVQFEVPIPTNKSLVLSPDSITKEEE